MNVLNSSGSDHGICGACRSDGQMPFPFTMAFQPIVSSRGVFGHEALVRGPAGESAASVLAKVNETNLYAFDQACRVRAIELAASLSDGCPLPTVSINFFPGAVYRAETCIRKTLETAARVGMPLDRIIFEVNEGERVTSRSHLMSIFREYRRHGLKLAIDDFGAGYAGLDLLAEFQPDILKLDMALIRDIDERAPSRAIVRAVVSLCMELGIQLVAEGVERVGELEALRDLGVELFQGYLLAKPALERLAGHQFPGQPRAAGSSFLSRPSGEKAAGIAAI